MPRSRTSKILALANMKGGTGKTTCSIGLAGAFAEAGERVLVVDLDGQANLTQFFLTRLERPTIYDVLIDQLPIARAIQPSAFPNIDVAPADSRLHHLATALQDQPDQAIRLDTALQERQRQRQPYDLVLLDCPPNLGPATTNALAAADAVLIPLAPAQFSVEGLWQIVEFVGQAKRLNPKLAVEGVLINLFNARRAIELTYADTLQRSAGVRVLEVRIKDSAKYVEAIAARKPITHYAPRSEHAQAFRELARIIHPIDQPALAHAKH